MLIEEALYQLLRDNPGVSAITEGRIFPVTIPQLEKDKTAYPALVYTLTQRQRSQTHDGPDGLVKSYFQLECIAKKYTVEAKPLADAVRLAVNGKSAALAAIYGMHVKGVFLQDERDTYGFDEVEQLSLYDAEMDLIIQHREALT